MPVVVRDGADLYWEKIGAGPALILGAGLNGSGTLWNPNRSALAERFTVYTFDQRGTGLSDRSLDGATGSADDGSLADDGP